MAVLIILHASCHEDSLDLLYCCLTSNFPSPSILSTTLSRFPPPLLQPLLCYLFALASFFPLSSPSFSPRLPPILQLRCGPNYAKNKKKSPSLPMMYECFAVDLVQCDTKIADFLDKIEIPDDVLNFDEVSNTCVK